MSKGLRWTIWALLALGVAAALGFAGWWWFAGEEPPRRERPPATVTATVAELTTWQGRLEAVGAVTPLAGVDVSAEVAGQVAALHFESGAHVHGGQPLAQLDDGVERAHLRSLEASAALAAVQLQRQEGLLEAQAVTQEEVDAARAALQVARARVAEQRAVVAKKAIAAPFGGELGLRRVDLGQHVEPGDPLVNLQTLRPIHVDLSLPQRELARVELGQEVEVTSDAYPARVERGRVSAIAPALGAATRGVEVQVTCPNEGRRLRPGMFVSVRVLLAEAPAYVTLPRTAVVSNPYGEAVFVLLGQPGALTASRVYVRLGEERGEQVAVLAGVEPGQRVVTSGQLKLQDGARVRVDEGERVSAEPSPVPAGP
ncbi:MAG: efflux RND transporter periplasmic adaptor subunit [Planctomycetota bacterium]